MSWRNGNSGYSWNGIINVAPWLDLNLKSWRNIKWYAATKTINNHVAGKRLELFGDGSGVWREGIWCRRDRSRSSSASARENIEHFAGVRRISGMKIIIIISISLAKYLLQSCSSSLDQRIWYSVRLGKADGNAWAWKKVKVAAKSPLAKLKAKPISMMSKLSAA